MINDLKGLKALTSMRYFAVDVLSYLNKKSFSQEVYKLRTQLVFTQEDIGLAKLKYLMLNLMPIICNPIPLKLRKTADSNFPARV